MNWIMLLIPTYVRRFSGTRFMIITTKHVKTTNYFFSCGYDKNDQNSFSYRPTFRTRQQKLLTRDAKNQHSVPSSTSGVRHLHFFTSSLPSDACRNISWPHSFAGETLPRKLFRNIRKVYHAPRKNRRGGRSACREIGGCVFAAVRSGKREKPGAKVQSELRWFRDGGVVVCDGVAVCRVVTDGRADDEMVSFMKLSIYITFKLVVNVVSEGLFVGAEKYN